MAKQQRKEGMIVAVPAGNGKFAVAQVLGDPELVVLDLFLDEAKEPSSDAINSARPLFRSWVMKSAITSGEWKRVAIAAIREEFSKPIPRFRRDIMSGNFYIRLDGSERHATKEECVGMEPASVLSRENIEQRLKLHLGLLDKKQAAFVRAWLACEPPGRAAG